MQRADLELGSIRARGKASLITLACLAVILGGTIVLSVRYLAGRETVVDANARIGIETPASTRLSPPQRE